MRTWSTLSFGAAGARHQRGQQILEALLLGHDHGPQHAHQRRLVTDICDSFDFQ